MATAATTKNLSHSATKQSAKSALTRTQKQPAGIKIKQSRMTQQSAKSPRGK